MRETRLRICPFCEATCGLAVEVEGRRVVGVRGDEADVFSRGHLCPKGVAIAELDADPDRLRRPLVRRGRDFAEASWEEAFAVVAERLPRIQAEHGRDAVGVFRRQCRGAQPRALALQRRAGGRAPHQELLQRRHHRPAAQAGGGRGTLRDGRLDPDPGRGPHAAALGARREPAGLEREPDDGARHRPAPAWHPGAGWPRGGVRPAPERDGSRGGRARGGPAGDGCAPALRRRERAVRGRACRARAPRAPRGRPRRARGSAP